MRRIWLSFFLLSAIFPVLAQEALDRTYTLDTGTQIAYPSAWQPQITNDLLVLVRDSNSRLIVIDYPTLTLIVLDQPQPLHFAVETIANEIIGSNINQGDIQAIEIAGRSGARYDIVNTSANGSVIALRFSNDTIGMVVALNLPEATLTAILPTFDNSEAPQRADIEAGQTFQTDAPGIYVFRSGNGRFTFPAGWDVTPRLFDTLEYVNITAPDRALTALLFDLSNLVAESTPLRDVLSLIDLDLQQAFGVTYGAGTRQKSGEHETFSYPISVQIMSATATGRMTLIRFGEHGIGLVIIYGDLERYANEVFLLEQSFNSVNASLQYMQ